MSLRRLVSPLLVAWLVALGVAGCRTEEDRDSGPGSPAPTTIAPPAPDPTVTAPPPRDLSPFVPLEGITTVLQYGEFGQGLPLWQERVPGIEDVRIRSTADGTDQPALWLAPGDQRPAPLLVVLHSWSTAYMQHTNIPFGVWADRNGWAMVAPNFRGVNAGPQATGSDLAVQDVIDAVDFAVAQGGVDRDRVFLIGYSGGGMMSLLVAGRHPDRFGGAVSWVPVYDLVDWYGYVRAHTPQAAYSEQIIASCGGDPTSTPEARQACQHRSPAAHVHGAAEANVPVYIGHGVSDRIVPPDYGVRAFNDLAEPGDRLGEPVSEALRQNSVPEDLHGSVTAPTYFEAGDPEVFVSRASGPVTLVLFDGQHDMVYNPGLAWAHRIAASP
ncbi:MAG TPA: alpha/beta fold hydrolase [Acidimicrobiales bacterium]|nr:alpha/beta fold hydrolase [Acidimicrobiales bacterium]